MGKLIGVEDMDHRLELASEELRVADEEVRAQQELIDGLLRGRTAERLASLRLAAALPVPVVETDRSGVVREANPAAASLFHLEPARLRGKPLAVLVDQGDRRPLRSALARAAAGGRVEQLSVTLTPRRDGAVPADVVVIGDDRPRLPQPAPAGGVLDESPVLRFVIAPRGGTQPGSEAAMLAALGSAATLSAVDGDLRTALTRLAELAVQGVAPAVAASIAVGPPAEPDILVGTDVFAQAADGDQHRRASGPSWDAYASCRPVATAALHADPRWPALGSPAAAETDAAAAVPVSCVHGEAGGVLTLYGTAGLADPVEVRRAALFADAAAALLREHHAVAELRRQEGQLREALTSRAMIDQAKGILMARHGIDAEAAFAELVRLSQHGNVKLRDVARQLVAEVSAGPPGGRRSQAARTIPSAGS